MDFLSSVFTWLSEHEAGISAVVGIAVLTGIVFAGVRWLLLRGTAGTPQKLLVRPGRRTVLIAAAAAVVLVLAGVVAWLLLPAEPATEIASETDPMLALPTGPTVAVLPFENLSRDPDQEYFSDGLTDGIITALSRFKDLFVIARNSTFRYKGKPVDVRQLEQDLGAHYVLEGSVQKAASTLRVTVQLLDAKDGTHLWAETYDRELSASNIFAVQDEITEQVVATIASIDGVISRARFAEVHGKPTASLDSYECVLYAGSYFRNPHVAADNAKVHECLVRAVRSDPTYADAWANLSLVYRDQYAFDYSPLPDPLDRAFHAARRAIELDPTNQLPHLALAGVYFFRHELDAFLAEADRILRLNPNNASIVGDVADMLTSLDDERALALVTKAAKLDPFHPTWFNFTIAAYHFNRGQYEDALAAARKIDEPGGHWSLLYLAAIYAELDRQEEAQAAVEELQKLKPGYSIESRDRELRQWNYTQEARLRWLAALRKAGLPE